MLNFLRLSTSIKILFAGTLDKASIEQGRVLLYKYLTTFMEVCLSD